MARVNVPLAEAPEIFVSLEAGIYELEIVEEPEIRDNKSGKGQHLRVIFKVTGDSPMAGRGLRDHISFENKTTLKRLLISAGMREVAESDDGFDTSDLLGAVVKAQVIREPYKDTATGEDKEAARLRDYIIGDGS